MTECNQTFFPFEAHFSRRVVAQFEGSWLTTEGGSLLLRQVDRKIDLLRRVARCFTDYRQPERIAHRLEEMLAQRIYGLALGYEDLNDHEQLRQDPLLGVLAGKRDLSEPLAGKSTLNRLELTPAGSPAAERYNKIAYAPEAIDELLVKFFLESHRKAPKSIVLDLDATDTPLHGKQEARFFHGYYNHYLPRYIFREDQLLCARLRPWGSNLFEQFVRVPRGNSQIRSAKVLNQGKVYSDHFSLSIKKRPTRTTECCRGVVNDLIPKHVADMALGSGWPNELLRSHPQQDLANVLSAARNLLCNLGARPGKNAFNAGRVANQDDGFPCHAGFASIIELKQLRMKWRRGFEFERCKIHP
jgi:hypothetical protein